jgi:ribonuclease PH
LHMALGKLVKNGALKTIPLTDQVAAISCGICNGVPVLDLDYAEDSCAMTDANFVLTGTGRFVEIQSTAEQTPFDKGQFDSLLGLAQKGVGELAKLQRAALGL